ncbi:MAG: hypothetical protein WDZ84_07150 [Rhodovibrionaceae bacterium]
MLTIHSLKTVALCGALTLGLAACAAQDRGPNRVGEDQPTFTYTFDGSERELQEARYDAEDECRDRYGRDSDLIETYQDGDDYIAVFECD